MNGMYVRVSVGLGNKVVENELILGAYLQIVSRFGLSIVHRILLHAHEGGVGVCLAEGVSLAERFPFSAHNLQER